jgi:GAF domain-containing protein
MPDRGSRLTCHTSSLYDDPSDAIWAGCIAVPKGGRLCEHTIAQLPHENGDPAYFEVLDLTQDDRFKELPFVTAEPFFKYYCGVPLRTKNGTPIGSLFALDDKVRRPINRTEKMCKIMNVNAGYMLIFP